MTTIRVGDPDPTPVGDSKHAMCMAEDPITGEYCTWRRGDKGDEGMHIAGNGSTVVAVWPMVKR